MRIVSAIAVAAALLFGIAACGGSSSDSTSDTDTSSSATAQEAPVQAAGGGWATLKRYAGPNADKLIIPQGPSPDHVVIRDLKVGSGAAIAPGNDFLSDYVSFSYESEKVVEPAPGEGAGPLPWVDAGSLAWGKGERVPGWEPGLKGIRAGGLRELIVPSQLAYENGPRVYLVKVKKIEPQ